MSKSSHNAVLLKGTNKGCCWSKSLKNDSRLSLKDLTPETSRFDATQQTQTAELGISTSNSTQTNSTIRTIKYLNDLVPSYSITQNETYDTYIYEGMTINNIDIIFPSPIEGRMFLFVNNTSGGTITIEDNSLVVITTLNSTESTFILGTQTSWIKMNFI